MQDPTYEAIAEGSSLLPKDQQTVGKGCAHEYSALTVDADPGNVDLGITPTQQITYLELLGKNANYRYVWLSFVTNKMVSIAVSIRAGHQSHITAQFISFFQRSCHSGSDSSVCCVMALHTSLRIVGRLDELFSVDQPNSRNCRSLLSFRRIRPREYHDFNPHLGEAAP